MCRASRMGLQHNIIIRHVAHKTCNAICHMRAGQVSPASALGPESSSVRGLMFGFWSGNGHKILCSLMHVTLARRQGAPRPMLQFALETCSRGTSSVKFLAAYFSGHPSFLLLGFVFWVFFLLLTHASFSATHLQQSLSNVTQDLSKIKAMLHYSVSRNLFFF